MLKSMTGFGRCEMATDEYKISVEMKAVNHRYLDLSIKMPKKFNYFEAAIRAQLKKYIQRGKVDVFISYEDYTDEKMSLKYNRSLAGEYMDYFRQMADELGIPNDATVMRLARCPEVFTMEQVPEDEEHMWQILEKAIGEAAEKFVETRTREGENLKQDLLGKLDYMVTLVDQIEERSPKIVEEYRAKLEDKVKELFHENYRANKSQYFNKQKMKCTEGYHKQKLPSESFFEVIQYIKYHDAGTVKRMVKKSRLEKLLEMVEMELKMKNLEEKDYGYDNMPELRRTNIG